VFFYRSPNSSLASDEELYSLIITLICSKFNCKNFLLIYFLRHKLGFITKDQKFALHILFVDIMQKQFLILHIQSATRARVSDFLDHDDAR